MPYKSACKVELPAMTLVQVDESAVVPTVMRQVFESVAVNISPWLLSIFLEVLSSKSPCADFS